MQAFTQVDAAHAYVELTAGTYQGAATLTGTSATVVGVNAIIKFSQGATTLDVASSGHLVVRHLSVDVGPNVFDAINCYANSSLEVDDVTAAGGGIHGDTCPSVRVVNSHFMSANISFNDGGLTNAGLLVDRSILQHGGISVIGGSFFAQITNSLIVDPGGFPLSLRSLTNGLPGVETQIANNTFVGGTIACNNPAQQVPGVQPRSFDSNILVDYDGSLPHANFCRWDYNLVMPSDPALAGVGNFSADPKFIDASAGDYHLATSSPAIDAGDPISTVDHDLDDHPRTGRVDLGAYEH